MVLGALTTVDCGADVCKTGGVALGPLAGEGCFDASGTGTGVVIPPLPSYDIDVCVRNWAVQRAIAGATSVITQDLMGAMSE